MYSSVTIVKTLLQCLFGAFCVTVIISWMFGIDLFANMYQRNCHMTLQTKHDTRQDSQTPNYNPTKLYNQAFYQRTCSNKNLSNSLDNVMDIIEYWKTHSNPICLDLYKKFNKIFLIQRESGELFLPLIFKNKLKHVWKLSDSFIEDMVKQNVTTVTNVITEESTIFNPLRDRRPISKPVVSQWKYVNDMASQESKHCDLCSYKTLTAVDELGRLESKHSYSMANAFKFGAWHSMIVFRQHDPLGWSQAAYMDVFQNALLWFSKVQKKDARYKNPSVFWDLLPHASASQIHPHIHVTVTQDRFYGILETWREALEKYSLKSPNSNYFLDLVEIHTVLNLSFTYKTATAFASITPKRDHEVVVLSRKPDRNFLTLLYYVIRAFIEDLDRLCFSMAMLLPPMGSSSRPEGGLPVFARIVTRGVVNDVRSDVSSLELFAAPNVNVDPKRTMDVLRRSINRRLQDENRVRQ